MKIQVLFFAGCPNYKAAVDLVRSVAPHATAEEVEVRPNDDVERMRFLGSPTILIDGVDVEAGARARSDFGFSCRTYMGNGLPSRELVASAIAGAASRQSKFAESRSSWLSAGSMAMAVIASACCWLPLVLVACGVSAAGLPAAFEMARPWFFAGCATALAVAFYMSYRKQSCCTAACKRGVLWAATIVSLAFAAVSYSGALVGFVEQSACCVAPKTETATALASAPSQCGESAAHRAPRDAATLTVLSKDAHELKDVFNADKGCARVMMLVSPRCPMCQAGARLVEEQALAQISSDKLKIYVVWIKRFFGDSREAAEKSMALVPDARARHFWDGENQMPKFYGRALDLPGERNFAWDVYFVFDPQAQWGGTPPTPDFWMHQLGGSDTDNRLDGERFREAIRKRLPE
jgi:hypothetical protein